MKVGFVGLGKLGLPVALAVESKGHKVYGFDIKKEIYEQIKNRKIGYKEKHANDLLKKTKIEIVELKKLIKLSDIIFVPIQTIFVFDHDFSIFDPIRFQGIVAICAVVRFIRLNKHARILYLKSIQW